MERTLHLSIALASALGTFAQLAPQRPAPLAEHLREVNAEWRTRSMILTDGDRPVTFTNDTERIAAHLHLVQQHLSRVAPEGLSADQAHARAKRLAELDRYADRGLFPQNHVLPYRNPVFIDPHNTACAVGQLMIESGAAELAARIDAEMETAYLRDMHWPEISAWATTNGFTADELAWIQPGYMPPYVWTSPGGGTNGSVTAMKRLQNGDLLIAGEFTEAGGSAAGHVAIWDGAGYVTLGDGVDGEITSAIEFEGDILLGGRFQGGTNDLARWNGSSWSYEAVFASKAAYISALHMHDGELYAAGELVGFAGVDDLVQRRTSSGWTWVGGVFNGSIHALGSHDGKLVAAGSFTGPDDPNDPLLGHVAILEGTEWQPLADGLDAPVYTLLDVGGTLYAGGEFYADGEPAFGFARIGAAAVSWEPLYPNHPLLVFPYNEQTRIDVLVNEGSDILFGGSFAIGSLGGTFGDNAAIWGGEADEASPLIAFMDGPVKSMATQGTTVYIGGPFSSNFPHIASTEFSTGVGEGSTLRTITISPNPVADVVTVRFPEGMDLNTPLRLIDGRGRWIDAPIERSGGSARLDVRGLSAGAYQIEANDGSILASGRFVKE